VGPARRRRWARPQKRDAKCELKADHVKGTVIFIVMKAVRMLSGALNRTRFQVLFYLY
jgi:hypothetical protein